MIVNPKGIDRPIQEMQQLFINNLWTNVENKQFYHRVFRNEKKGVVRPEVFSEIRNNYEEVIFDKRLNVLSWFDVADTTNSVDGEQVTQDVGVFFAVNLKKLYPNLAHRAVEETHRDVRNVILERPTSWKIEAISTGRSAYGDFEAELKGLDMQPWHVFRFNCNVSYTLNCK